MSVAGRDRLWNSRSLQSQGGFVSIQAHSGFFVLICLLASVALFSAGAFGFWAARKLSNAGDAPQKAGASASAADSALSGPWGDVIVDRVVLETPLECLSDTVSEQQALRWFFGDYALNELLQFFATVGISEDESRELLNTNRWEFSPVGITVKPLRNTVLGLSQGTRKRIYQKLALFPENVAQAQPYRWRAEHEAQLFKNAPASAETLATLKRLSYRHGAVWVFSDFPVLSAELTETERIALRATLSRQFALLFNLNVTARSDLDALSRYWGIGGSGKRLRPVLEAAARTDGGRKIPIVALIPPHMRSRLYTFPVTLPDARFDAYWTAANFFNPGVSANQVTVGEWLQRCKTEFHPLDSDPRFGDVLMVTRPDGRLLHSCVFLAADVVYTKNGAGPSAPWMLMTVNDVLDLFSVCVPEGQQVRTTYIRNNSL